MKRNKFKLTLLISLTIFFGGFTAIYLYNNINLLKDNVVEDLESFSEELKISAWAWTTTEVVSTESTDDSRSPTIVVDGSGNVHIAWRDETDYHGSGDDDDIFYKRWNAATATWTTTEVVSTESTDRSRDPTIAVDGSRNVHIAWQDETDYSGSGTDIDIFYKRWNAATATWTMTEVVSTASYNNSKIPTIAADGSGNVHIAWQDETNYSGSGTDKDIFYKRWNAATATWTTTEVVSTESIGAYDTTIAADGSGNVHIVWWDYTNYGGSGGDGDIFYKRWNATTATWTTTEVVSTESTGYSCDPTIAMDGSGNVHIAWEDYTNYSSSGTDLDIFYKRWNAASVTWTTTEVVSTESTDNSGDPTIAADGSGNVHIAWEDDTNYSGSGWNLDIFYKRWNAATATWTTTEVVSTESTGYSCDPTIAADGSGNVHIAWWDDTIYGGSFPDDDIFYKKFSSPPPLNPSIIINNGDASTNSALVTLTLSADGPTEMCFRNGTIGAWTSWEPYATAKQLYLEGSINNTEYSIYVKFRNAIGETSPIGDSILYLVSIPLNPSIIINNGDASTNSTLVNLTLSVDGAVEMCIRNGTTGAWTSWEAYSTTKQLYLEGSVNNAEYSICVKFQNAVGETSPVCDSILYLAEEGPPIIPGYSAGWIIISLLAGIGVIAILNKSKGIKLRN